VAVAKPHQRASIKEWSFGLIPDSIQKKIKLKSPINELPRTVRRIKTGLLIK
jgi:hypothetical protein